MISYKEIKKAITNPPPERLAKVEYQSHFLQILGTLAVCALLIYKGFWYIIFALIFGIGVSYSQGITAFQKYNAIKSIVGNEYNYNKDKSPSRKRDHVVKNVFGNYGYIISIIASFGFTYFLIGVATWYHKLSFALFIIFFHIIIYFFLFYYIAKPFYKDSERRSEK